MIWHDLDPDDIVFPGWWTFQLEGSTRPEYFHGAWVWYSEAGPLFIRYPDTKLTYPWHCIKMLKPVSNEANVPSWLMALSEEK